MRLVPSRAAAALIFLTLAACGAGKPAAPPAPLVRTLVVGHTQTMRGPTSSGWWIRARAFAAGRR